GPAPADASDRSRWACRVCCEQFQVPPLQEELERRRSSPHSGTGSASRPENRCPGAVCQLAPTRSATRPVHNWAGHPIHGTTAAPVRARSGREAGLLSREHCSLPHFLFLFLFLLLCSRSAPCATLFSFIGLHHVHRPFTIGGQAILPFSFYLYCPEPIAFPIGRCSLDGNKEDAAIFLSPGGVQYPIEQRSCYAHPARNRGNRNVVNIEPIGMFWNSVLQTSQIGNITEHPGQRNDITDRCPVMHGQKAEIRCHRELGSE